MKTHAQIIAAGNDEAIAEDRGVSVHTVRSWKQRDSIPGEHWNGIVRLQLATLDELARYAETKRVAA